VKSINANHEITSIIGLKVRTRKSEEKFAFFSHRQASLSREAISWQQQRMKINKTRERLKKFAEHWLLRKWKIGFDEIKSNS
jgi:hypothetical protein